MKTATVLGLSMLILFLCAGAAAPRDVDRAERVIMKGITEEELIDPRLENGEMRNLFTAASVDTYCLVWYDFEQMNWQGWTQVDVTAQVDTFFHVDDFAGLGGGAHGGLAPLEGLKSMWCGARDWDHQIPGCPGAFEYLCSWAAAPGYGNNWDQSLGWIIMSFASPLVVSYKLRCDTETDHDYFTFEGQNLVRGSETELARFDGKVDTVVTHTMYLSTASCKLRFHFVSDGGWSDQDGLYDTDGAVVVDSITVSHGGGLYDYEDFESCPVGATDTRPYGGVWNATVGEPFGNYSGLYNNLVDKDPCNDNFGTQIVFFINSPHPCPDYPFPGLFDTPFCKGPGNIEAPCQNEMVVSPIIDMTRYSMCRNEVQDTDIPSGTLPDLGGAHLRFCVYEDLPVQNLVFYTWQVRNIEPSGCPGQWLDRNIAYWYAGGRYTQRCEQIGDLITSNSIQVGLACIDMCDSWYQTYGNCANHTPAPWFDNVRLYRYSDIGPLWSYRDLDLFQDNFPGAEFDLESYVRADCANDLRPRNDPMIDPGDSIVVTCSSPRGGGIDTMPDGSPKVFMHVRCPYIGDPASPKPALYGPSLAGNYGSYYGDDGSEWTVIQGDYARTSMGDICPDRCMFDLNDSLFTRGYRIDYYFEAYDLAGESSTLPELPCDDTYFEWTCLPTLASDILYVDDYNRGAPPKGITQVYYDNTFKHVLYDEIDRYDVNNPSSAVSNGPGSRAKNFQLTIAYTQIIWDSGDLEMCTISDGTMHSDKSNDCQMLVDWMEFSSHNVGLLVLGDGVAHDLDGAPSAVALALLATYCGVQLVDDSYYDHSGIVNPMIEAEQDVGNPLWHTTWGDSFYLFGGCPVINEFDYLEKIGTGEYALRYPDVEGIPRYAGIYNIGINNRGYPIRTMWFGFSFMYIRDVEPNNWIPVRDEVLRDVLAWMEWIPGPTESEKVPTVTTLSQNYPNPFNPVTTISFSLKEKGHASLKIYDVAGRLIRTLVDEVRKAGRYEERWDGINNRGAQVASGVYFYRFRAGDFEKTKKMILLK